MQVDASATGGVNLHEASDKMERVTPDCSLSETLSVTMFVSATLPDTADTCCLGGKKKSPAISHLVSPKSNMQLCTL